MSDEPAVDLSLRSQIIANQRLINELNDKLARKHHEVRVIQQISSEINASLHLDEILEVILRAMDEVLGFTHSMIVLYEPEAQMLTVAASRGFDAKGVGAQVRVGQGIIGMVAKRRRIIRMGNIRSQMAYSNAVRERMAATAEAAPAQAAVVMPGLPNVDSQIAIPLQIKDKLVGVLSVESPRPNAFDELDEILLLVLGNQAATAIDHARLYATETQRLAELQRTTAQLAELNESLEQTVRDRTAALSGALEQVEAEQRRGMALLERMVPKQVIPLLLKDQLEASRLQATVLFTDLEGFTEYSSSLEPGEVFSQLNYFFTQVGEHIESFRGYVNKTNGDSIMALFGVPNESPTHAFDAVLAGLRIQSDLDRHQALNMRVGINTGILTAGMTGPHDKSRYDVLGDAVNVASRMEKLCRPGRVTITESTYQLVAPYFEIVPLGEHEVKGKGATLAYEVQGLKPIRQDPRRIEPTSRFAEQYLEVFTEIEQIKADRFDMVDFLSIQARDGSLQHNEAAAGFALAFLRHVRAGGSEQPVAGRLKPLLAEITEEDLVAFLLLHDLGKFRIDSALLTDCHLSKDDHLRMVETLRVLTGEALGQLELTHLVPRLDRFAAFGAARGHAAEADPFTVLVTVADWYDTLTAPQAYRGKPWSIPGALEEISRMPYARQEPYPLVQAFVEFMRPSEKAIKSGVKSAKIFR